MEPDDRTEGARERLFQRFRELGIAAEIVPYPVARSVEDGKQMRGAMSGTFTKNLLLRDKKDRLFLVSIHEDRSLDLRTLHAQIGASGRLGFAPSERMIDVLGVSPGALTPLAIIDDIGGLVSVVLDGSLLRSDQVNFHPLVPGESVGLHPDELVAYVRSCGREPLILDLESA